METNGMLTGLIYQDKVKQNYEEMVYGFKQESLAGQNIKITEEEFTKLVQEFK
jgi:2-oxoglutarate ferredoxin oxidoreductase subunit beta